MGDRWGQGSTPGQPVGQAGHREDCGGARSLPPLLPWLPHGRDGKSGSHIRIGLEWISPNPAPLI